MWILSQVFKKVMCMIGKKERYWDFSGGPVANTLHSQFRGRGFDPWSRNQLQHATAK